MSYLSTFEDNYAILGKRLLTYKRIIEHLEKIENPIIIETGTTRNPNNMSGDGCSTIIFNQYLNTRFDEESAKIYSPLTTIDISSWACEVAKSVTDDWVNIICSDSVRALSKLEGKCDLLYLDSYDLERENRHTGIFTTPNGSAEHHLKELLAAYHLLKEGTLIVIDDSPNEWNYGKGQLVKEFFDAIGIEPLFSEYQIGWIWRG